MKLSDTLKKLTGVLTAFERRRVYLIACFAVVIVLIEMLSAAVLFLIANAVVNFSQIENNQYYKLTNSIVSVDGVSFIYMLLGVMLLLITFVVLLRSILIFTEARFMLTREYAIGQRILQGLINKPYEFVVRKNGSEITKTVLSEVVTVVENGLYPLNTIITQSLLVSGMLIVMLVASPLVTLTMVVLILSLYVVIYKTLGKKIDIFSAERLHSNGQRFKIIDNFFGVYKNAKVEGSLSDYINSFSYHSHLYARSNANLLILSSLPKGIVELFLISTVLTALALTVLSDSLENLSVFSIFIYAGYKILPAAQSLYAALAKLRFVGPSLLNVLENLPSSSNSATRARMTITDFNGLDFDDVSYRYPEKTEFILRNVNISLPSTGYVGVVGPSGSGKTTFIDLLTGLLVPTRGRVHVNVSNGGKHHFEHSLVNLSYVPQDVYLFDSTILFNITLDLNASNHDSAWLASVLHSAGLTQLIGRLPNGLLTQVGDKGSILSGGEKQRIGLARALYRNSDVLVLDEVTNALDGPTQNEIVNSIERIAKDKLVISITHSLDNLRNANQIVHICSGTLTTYDSFVQIVNRLD